MTDIEQIRQALAENAEERKKLKKQLKAKLAKASKELRPTHYRD